MLSSKDHPGALTARALPFLEYAQPVVIPLWFAITLVCTANCTTQSRDSRRGTARSIHTAQTLIALICLLYLGQAGSYVIRACVQEGWWTRDSDFIHLPLAALPWGWMLVRSVNESISSWYPYLGGWIVNLVFEVAIWWVDPLEHRRESAFAIAKEVSVLLRIAAASALIVVGFSATRRPDGGQIAEEEDRPLLEAGALPDDESIAETNGWWCYRKDFFMFVPLMWPRNDRKLQVYTYAIFATLIADRVLNVLVPRQLGIVVDALVEGVEKKHIPFKPIALWFGFRLSQSSAGYPSFRNAARVRLENYARTNISKYAFNHVMDLSMDFHEHKDSGEIAQSMQQAQSLNQLVDLVFIDIVPVLIDLLVATIYVTRLFDAYLGLVLVVFGFFYSWLSMVSTDWTKSMRRVAKEKDRTEKAVLYQVICNWMTVMYCNRREYEQDRYGKHVDEAVMADNRFCFFKNLSLAGQELVMLLSLLSAVLMASNQIVQGMKPVGNFIVLVTYWVRLTQPLLVIAGSHRRMSMAFVDAERLIQLLKKKPTIQDNANATELVVSKGEVKFAGVNFAYEPRRPVLRGVSFTARPGQTVALVGESGCGKSTIMKLLLRVFDPQTGKIEIDGQDVRTVTMQSLREASSIVSQDPLLFNMSIHDNVRYANPDATDEDIISACSAAAIHEKIMSFPDGYNTMVGEGGMKMSGGEKQRIAIARAMIKDSPIVILDEATSALDSVTEARIQEALDELIRGRTTFMIAHRLSTMMKADLILVIADGRICQAGTHQDLLADEQGRYHLMWTTQTGGRVLGPKISTDRN